MGFSLPVCAVLAATTLAFHFILMIFVGARSNVSVGMSTSLDGILLQGYFTGALSYLPLSSDMEMRGTVEDKAKCSMICMMLMLIVSLVLDMIGNILLIPLLQLWSAHVLLYLFVISFPLQPLNGSDIWSHSRSWWMLIFMMVLSCFLLNIPEPFYEIL